ncbi:S53 family peptidase [Telmatobacter bradus]|uniref:S53 family peptidase n=1 Tax=Telmatobacter bradus TaxID=474953 RepID=UPI003B4369D9
MGARRYLVAAAYFLLAGVSLLSAQAVANRIQENISSLSTVAIAGSTHPRAQAANDAGRMDPSTRLQGITLQFSLTSAQQAALDQLVEEQQTPGSTNYHKWLTPAQFASRFGMSDNDLAQVESWLEQQGFSVDSVANARTSLRFSGTVRQVEQTFNTQMHNYTVSGVSHFANSTNLSLPAELSGVVQSVRNLDNFRPHPHYKVRSNYTVASSGDYYMTPADVATIYDITAAYSAGYTGAGQSIAVLGQSAVVTSDITKFQTAAGLSSTQAPTLVLVPDTGTAAYSSDDEEESDLDLEYTSTIAKGATIYFVYTGSTSSSGVYDAIEYAVDNRIAPILSISYGTCEPDLGSLTEYNSLNAYLEQGATQGQSIIVSSGDSGSTGCYQDYASGSVTTAEKALAVEFPASSAYVTAVGGTEFPSAYLTSTYWSTTNTNGGSAKSYIPEQVWNDDSATYGSEYGAAYAISSGGGGVSGYTPLPSWQSTSVTGISTATSYSTGYRMVPDIALDASNYNAPYLFCSSVVSSSSCSSGFYSSSSDNESSLEAEAAGGTSFAAPIFAGMLAILNQAKNYDYQGLINTELYTLAANSSYYPATITSNTSAPFNDITSGGNYCNAGSSYCSTTNGAESDYATTTGYDEASGLGSVNLNNLIALWPANSDAAAATYGSTTTLSANTTTPTSGATDAITITVASGSSSSTTAPTGTLTVYVDGTLETSTLALTAGTTTSTATYSFSSTTSGTHTIVAVYPGDSTYFPSTGSVIVTIASSTTTTGSFTVTLASSSVTIKSGSSGTDTVTVTPANGYTGTVDWKLSTSSTSIEDYACYAISDASVTSTSAVSKTLTLYMGESACSAAGAVKSNLKYFKTSSTLQQARNHPPAHNSLLSVSMASLSAMGMLLAGFAGRRRRALRGFFGLMALAFVGLALTACGSKAASTSSSSSSSSTTTSTNVPTGTYTISLEGYDSSSSSINSTATLTVVVDY